MADASAPSKITTPEELDDLFAASHERPVWLFKHSLICPTSARAWDEFREFAERQPASTEMAVIEIQRARDLSRQVAERTGVKHESPQVLLLTDGNPVWQASHGSITAAALDRAAAATAPLETAGC